ncbi:MAG TPA: hypothetical protein VFR09_04640 [Alphaproteobacteria bacterium]|nr:hypothetical protein [Alphaproteobacteria bacterium]
MPQLAPTGSITPDFIDEGTKLVRKALGGGRLPPGGPTDGGDDRLPNYRGHEYLMKSIEFYLRQNVDFRGIGLDDKRDLADIADEAFANRINRINSFNHLRQHADLSSFFALDIGRFAQIRARTSYPTQEENAALSQFFFGRPDSKFSFREGVLPEYDGPTDPHENVHGIRAPKPADDPS